MDDSGLTVILPAPQTCHAHENKPLCAGFAGAGAALLLAVASALAANPALARDRDFSPRVAEDPVIVYQNTPDQRRAELRRALMSGADLPQAPAERRRLSPERRDMLNQELRDAVRDAYQQRGMPGR